MKRKNRSGDKPNEVKQKPPQKSETLSENKPRKITSIGYYIGAMFRWGFLVVILVLLAGGLSARDAARNDLAELKLREEELKQEQAVLQEEVDRFSDPEWRESYWKWRTMRHEPGEYYIEFVEPGII